MVSTDGPMGASCEKTQTWTATYSNTCWTSDSKSITYTWTVVTAPVFDNCVSGTTALGCDPTLPICATDITAYNECGPVRVSCTPGEIQVNGFNRSQTFTYTAEGACEYTSTCVRTFTWFVSQPFTCIEPVKTTVLCGVTIAKAQENTDTEFSEWLAGFTYDTNLYTVDISYEYDPITAKPISGAAPIIPLFGDIVKTTVTWTLTNKETGCKNSCSSTFTIDNGCKISCSSTKTDVLCEGTETGSITISADGGATPYTVYLYKEGSILPDYTKTGIIDNPFSVTFENLPAGMYTYEVIDANYDITKEVCNQELPIEVGRGIPCEAHCTYTQGAYGNIGGMSCSDGNQYTTIGLIAKALDSYPLDTMTIGLPGKSISMSNNETDIAKIIQVLPGGGGSMALIAGDFLITGMPASYLKKGNINNTLLAQTITLGLNLGIDSELGSFILKGGVMAIAKPQGGCGSEIPMLRVCNADGTVTNEYQYYTIPSDMVLALGGNPTVQGLFDLANQALGGGSTNGVSLSKIASLVDLINNAFDECRIFMGYDVPSCPEFDLVISPINQVAKVSETSKAGFDAYPIPFKDVLTIRYKFDYISEVKIEVYNSNGILMISKVDSNGYLNKEIRLNIDSNREQEQVYVVKVTTNRGSNVKKIMSSK